MSEVRRQVPGLRMLAEYRAGWLPHDVVAGLVLTTLLVPQGMAYAELPGLLVGAITSLGAIARLGFIADLLSKPTMIGYMNGLAVTILIGQLPKLFGFSTDATGLLAEAGRSSTACGTARR